MVFRRFVIGGLWNDFWSPASTFSSHCEVMVLNLFSFYVLWDLKLWNVLFQVTQLRHCTGEQSRNGASFGIDQKHDEAERLTSNPQNQQQQHQMHCNIRQFGHREQRRKRSHESVEYISLDWMSSLLKCLLCLGGERSTASFRYNLHSPPVSSPTSQLLPHHLHLIYI